MPKLPFNSSRTFCQPIRPWGGGRARWVCRCLRRRQTRQPADLCAKLLAKNEAKTAVVHAKNALNAADTGEARFVLSRSLLAAGDTQAALVHLQQARAAKHLAREVEPEIARALLSRGEYKRLTAELAPAWSYLMRRQNVAQVTISARHFSHWARTTITKTRVCGRAGQSAGDERARKAKGDCLRCPATSPVRAP